MKHANSTKETLIWLRDRSFYCTMTSLFLIKPILWPSLEGINPTCKARILPLSGKISIFESLLVNKYYKSEDQVMTKQHSSVIIVLKNDELQFSGTCYSLPFWLSAPKSHCIICLISCNRCQNKFRIFRLVHVMKK
ncbi:unnamed protein product [Moneuplotes crassus]|uniref:Uncharacterized protein n=1 Tax=Euplotes crassus TaxID=5936 RepID=A0AAD1U9Q3_EUPCR|nr:unnamed protein product [Moneuplotes crassus]